MTYHMTRHMTHHMIYDLQEKRMSKAIEVMINHVENVKMVHERINAELEEAR